LANSNHITPTELVPYNYIIFELLNIPKTKMGLLRNDTEY